ncbi:MAG: hypothetical protein RMM58_13790 [Chloroflexota bacterium]|nr:hypothetical protein [Dehalococcoidia bacterium]MDW8254943.1 hypothetical protein [Chloroflexota bacterium]
MVRLRALAALGALLLVGCAIGQPSGSPSVEPPVPPEAAPLVAQAKAKLALEKGRDPSAVLLQRIEATTFNDTSLGCPEPGRSYLQVLTPGYIITLRLDAATYTYHAGRDTVVRCDGK